MKKNDLFVCQFCWLSETKYVDFSSNQWISDDSGKYESNRISGKDQIKQILQQINSYI